MSTAKKVVFNTLIIYGKTLVTVVISLFSTRLLLNSLGVEDFGLFNVIGGLISMLAFLNAAMTVSTQRYISHNIGEGNLENVKRIFANSVILHISIAFLLVIFIEVAGLYFLNYKLKIDPARLYIANIVFHFVVVSTFFTIISVPYDAIINAHENMMFLAIVGIVESIMKLLIALYLFISLQDRLLMYALLIMLCTIIIRAVKQLYVRKKYKETHGNYFKLYSKETLKELSSFAGWNLFGSFSYVARNQGMSILLNFFFSTVVNAAFGIANQVASQMNFFCSAMLQALNPQIMKSEGAKDRNRMLQFSMLACKLGFLLLAFIAIPCISEMKSILEAWLKVVPDHTIYFCSLILTAAMINQLTAGLDSAIQATGKIKNYMLLGGSIKLAIIPISYIFLRLKIPLYYVMGLYSFFEAIGGIVRVNVLGREAGLSAKVFLSEVIFKVAPVATVIILLNFFFSLYWHYEFRWLISIPISSLLFLILAYFISLSPSERNILTNLFMSIKAKFIGAKLKAI
jgi:O-antigen/teichoic acid export membrane protein